ncbi:MFS transporter [Streptomyces sp. I05A-00742]|uniref:MFS transporter n=1 Tax=Streptomyces sp. I05A-00742 TaxID=2732853 RepID=UPI0014899AD5|nr:MFS transporter [Streptomyces sp. I05A-00742]
MQRDAKDLPIGKRDPAEDGRPRWVLVAIAGVLSFVAMLDMNIVNVSLADIARDLRVSAPMAQWAVLGYQLAVVALLLPAGRWLDVSGSGTGTGLRSAVLMSTSGFALCGLLSAASPWMPMLATARVLQGAFGAVLFVLMPVLAARSVPPHLRGRAMSVPATLGPLGAVTGPAVGGVLLDAFGWRAVFLVKLPFCVAALLVARRVLPGPGRPVPPNRRLLADAGLVGSAITALLLALTLAPTSPVWLLLVLAALPPAVRWLRGPGARPVIDVVRASGTHGVYAAVFALACGFGAMHYVVALRLQDDSGLSATATGLTVLAFPLAMGIAGPLGGRLADRYGHRPTAVAGATLTTLGLFLLTLLGRGDWSSADVAWRMALAGAGMGLYGGPTQALVMNAAPPRSAGTAGSAVQLSRNLGFTLGPALASATWGLAGSPHGARYALAVAAAAAALAFVLLVLRRATAGESEGAPASAPPVSR